MTDRAHEIAIRPLTEADADWLWEMLYQAIYVSPGGEPPPRQIVHAPDLAHYAEGWGRDDDIGYLAADVDSLLVGAAWLRLLTGADRGYGYVDDATPELSVAIVPDCRGQGIGTRLLAALLDAAGERYTAVSLSVQADNPALRLYRRLGFEVVEDGGTWFTMRKSLGRGGE
jgi:ribosomal protein S18 acetylase RimI-like enzyme